MKDVFIETKKRELLLDMLSTVRATALKKMSVIQLISMVLDATDRAGELVPDDAKPYVAELQKRLSLSTPYEVVFLSVFVDRFDCTIYLRDIAGHFRARSIAILEHIGSIDSLVKRKIIRRTTGRNDEPAYKLSNDVLNALKHGKIIEPKSLSNLNITDFINEIDDVLDRAQYDCMTNDELSEELSYLIDNNQNLYFAQKLKEYKFFVSDLVLYLRMALLFINDSDDFIGKHNFEDWFGAGVLRHIVSELEYGSHTLMKLNLVEHATADGQIDPEYWKLTEFSKMDILQELKLTPPSKPKNNLTKYESIKEKQLFYNARVSKEVSKLNDLLDDNRMKRVLKRMEENGMRKGFTCIFYGGPGTGKTETVLQLARQSKRDIMFVDVPNIRSKWVGDSEKNIKRVFDQYKALAKDNDLAPILVFNEADAILTKRKEGGTMGVDKMENAMQNIILQEMENLEGIMIATTNLTGNLDSAFERRFLYKIEFDKPSVNERQHIWKTMIPDLSDNQAYVLAKKYDFSGGQIENIARKRIISDILEDRDDVDIEAIIESCDVELLNKKSVSSVGFV